MANKFLSKNLEQILRLKVGTKMSEDIILLKKQAQTQSA